MSSYEYFLNAACLRQSSAASSSCIDGDLGRKEFLTSPGLSNGTGSLYARCASSSVDYYTSRGQPQHSSYLQHQQQPISSGTISPQSPTGYQLSAADLKAASGRGSGLGLSLADLAFQDRSIASSGFNDLLQQPQNHNQQSLTTSNRNGNNGGGLQFGSPTTAPTTASSNTSRLYGNNNNESVVGYTMRGPPTTTSTRCPSPSLSPTAIKPMIVSVADDNSSGALSPPLSEASSPGSVASSDYEDGHHHLQHRNGHQSAGSNGIANGPTAVDDIKASSVGSASNSSSSSNESSSNGVASSGGSTNATSGARTPSLNEPTIYPWMRRVHSGHGGTDFLRLISAKYFLIPFT
jgi:hypothetical protein